MITKPVSPNWRCINLCTHDSLATNLESVMSYDKVIMTQKLVKPTYWVSDRRQMKSFLYQFAQTVRGANETLVFYLVN